MAGYTKNGGTNSEGRGTTLAVDVNVNDIEVTGKTPVTVVNEGTQRNKRFKVSENGSGSKLKIKSGNSAVSVREDAARKVFEISANPTFPYAVANNNKIAANVWAEGAKIFLDNSEDDSAINSIIEIYGGSYADTRASNAMYFLNAIDKKHGANVYSVNRFYDQMTANHEIQFWVEPVAGGKQEIANYSQRFIDYGFDVARKTLGGDWRLPTKEEAEELIRNTTAEWTKTGDFSQLFILNGYDAARDILGGDWRLPTIEDARELIANTTVEFVGDYKGSGVNGSIIRSKINGNSIFIPAIGYYDATDHCWNGGAAFVLTSESSESVRNCSFLKIDTQIVLDHFYRYNGRSIRPVSETQGVDLGLPSGLKWSATNLAETGLCANETDYGDFFAWGEKTAKPTYTWDNYMCNAQQCGTMQDPIYRDCDVEGIVLTSKINGAKIFFRPGGYYNSEDILKDDICYIMTSSSDVNKANNTILRLQPGGCATLNQSRCFGVNVRPVSETDGVDLGLPSGLKWSATNIGAQDDLHTGDYYAYGETEAKSNYNWDNYMCNAQQCGTEKDPVFILDNNMLQTGAHIIHIMCYLPRTWDSAQFNFLTDVHENSEITMNPNAIRVLFNSLPSGWFKLPVF